MNSDTARMKAILVLVATIFFVVGAYVVSFSGYDPDLFPADPGTTPAQPAGYAFAIWGLIFLWLLASAGFGLVGRAEDAGWDALRWPLFLSLAIGATWNSVANMSAIWATVLIWVMLGTALVALLRAPARDRAWLAWPVGLYAGWLTAASAVSLGVTLAGYGVLAPVTSAWLAIVVAAVVAAAVLRTTGNLAYAASVVWALAALIVKNSGTATSVVWLAALAIAALALLAFTARGARSA